MGMDLLGPFRILLLLVLLVVGFGPGIWVVMKLLKKAKKDPEKVSGGLIIVLGVALTFLFVFVLRVVFIQFGWYDGPIFPE
jgi:hypothetical protein